MTLPTTGPRLTAGADGWRGVTGADFTPAEAGRLADGVLRALAARGDRPSDVLVGFDGRAGGELTAAAVAEAVAGHADRVRIVRHLATPTATSAVRRARAGLALLVTASHNPPRWNGLKVKVAPGGPPRPETEAAAETQGRYQPSVTADWRPDAEQPQDWIKEHVAELMSRVPAVLRPLRVVVDGLGGVGGAPAVALCTALGWRVRAVGCDPDPGFGGLVPDPSRPASRCRAERAVGETGADLGLVLDGDGDRLYVIDDRGRSLRPDELLALLLDHRWATRPRGRRGVAVTVSTGSAVRVVARRRGDPVTEVPVGFKHLAPLLAAGGVDAAGGAVGDLAFADFGIDRDPLAAIVLLADLLSARDAPLSELLDGLRTEVGPARWFETRLADVPGQLLSRELADAAVAHAGLAARPARVGTTDGLKYLLADGQWLLFRPSSTEGGLRVYGELAETGPTAEDLAAALRAAASTRGALDQPE